MSTTTETRYVTKRPAGRSGGKYMATHHRPDPTRPPDLVAGDLVLHRTAGLLVVRFMDDEETRWGCCLASRTDFDPAGRVDVYLYPDHPPAGWSEAAEGAWPGPGGALLGDLLLIWRPTWRRMG